MKPARILCVDDYEPALKSLGLVLRRAGYDVVAAADSAALEALHDSTFDAAVIDYQMPGQDGLAVASTLKQRHPGMPIVMVSGYPAEISEQGIQAVDAFVAKGTQTAPELIAALNKLLHGPVQSQLAKDKVDDLKRATARSLQLDGAVIDRFESKS